RCRGQVSTWQGGRRRSGPAARLSGSSLSGSSSDVVIWPSAAILPRPRLLPSRAAPRAYRALRLGAGRPSGGGGYLQRGARTLAPRSPSRSPVPQAVLSAHVTPCAVSALRAPPARAPHARATLLRPPPGRAPALRP